jgi:hypothetical protein
MMPDISIDIDFSDKYLEEKIMYYIYEYVDPRNNLPFYIGKGSRGRKFNHLKETLESTDNRKKYFKIQKIKSLGMHPIINVIIDNITDENLAYKIEDEYILKYGREGFEDGGILTNICLNNRPPLGIGEKNGMFNKKHTDKAKKKVSDANKGKIPWNKGIPRDDALKEAVSKANKGKTAWNKGKRRSEEDRQKMKEGWAQRKEKGLPKTVVSNTHSSKQQTFCNHCEKTISGLGNYSRWHGNNCKLFRK